MNLVHIVFIDTVGRALMDGLSSSNVSSTYKAAPVDVLVFVFFDARPRARTLTFLLFINDLSTIGNLDSPRASAFDGTSIHMSGSAYPDLMLEFCWSVPGHDHGRVNAYPWTSKDAHGHAQ